MYCIDTFFQILYCVVLELNYIRVLRLTLHVWLVVELGFFFKVPPYHTILRYVHVYIFPFVQNYEKGVGSNTRYKIQDTSKPPLARRVYAA